MMTWRWFKTWWPALTATFTFASLVATLWLDRPAENGNARVSLDDCIVAFGPTTPSGEPFELPPPGSPQSLINEGIFDD